MTVTIVSGTPTTYSLDSGTAQAGTAFAGVANGNHTIVATDANGCSDSEAFATNCIPGCPTITVTGSQSVCAGTTAVYTQIGGVAGGVWSVVPAAAGSIDAGGNFASSGAFAGNATITYTDNSTGLGCAGSIVVVVNAITTPTFAAIAPICSGDVAPVLPATSSNGISGTWLPALVSNTTSGTYTFTPAAGACASTATVNVTVNPQTTPTFAAIAPICSGDVAPVLPAVSIEGIAGSWLPAVVSNTASGTYTFTPAAGACASTATVNVTVNPQTTPTFAAIAAICNGDVAPILPATSSNGITGTWLPALVSNTASGTYTFTPAAGSCASTATVNVTVNASPQISVSDNCTGATADVTVTIVSGTPTTYSLDSGTSQAGTTFAGVANGNHTIVATDANGCSDSEAFVTNCIPGCPTITVTGSQSVCAGATAVYTQVGGVAGGVWSVVPAAAGAIDAGGNFASSGAFAGNATITYTDNSTGLGCAGSIVVAVDAASVPTFAAIAPICSGDVAPVLPAVSIEGIAGTWLPAVVSNTASGTYTFTPAAGACASTATVNVTVNPQTTPTFAAIAPICSGDVAPVLPAVSIEGIAGSWLPAVVSNTASGTYTFTPAAGACASTATVNVTVNPQTTPTFAAIAPICSGDVAPVLPATSSNGITGTWLPAVVSNTASGTYTFTPAAGACASTATVNVTVNASPQISVSDNCTGATADVTVTIVSGTPTTYSLDNGTAQAGTTFVGVANGNHTIVATDANGCSDSEAFVTNCIPGCPTITVTGSQSVCAGATAVYTQAGGVAGGVWSVVPAAAGTIDAGGNFASSGAFAGNATITYTDNSTGLGCAGSIVVAVDAASVPTFAAIAPICSGDVAPILPATSSNGISGTWLPVLVSNTASGAYTFTPAAGACASTATVNVTVNPQTTPTFAPIAAICSGDVAPVLPAVSIEGIAGSWLPAVVSNTASGTYTFTPAAGACASTATVNVTVNPQTTPTFTAIAPICSGDVAPVLPAVSIEGIAGTWLPAVVSNTASGTYTFTPAAGACASTASVDVTVNPQTTPTFAAIAPICSGDIAPVLPAVSIEGIAGTWLPAVVSNTASGTYTFTPAAGACASTATVDVTVNMLPVASISGDVDYCIGDVASLTASGGDSYVWSNASNIETTTPSTLVAGTTAYTVTVTNNGCSNTTSITVTVSDCVVDLCPTIVVALDTVLALCDGKDPYLDGWEDFIQFNGNSNTFAGFDWYSDAAMTTLVTPADYAYSGDNCEEQQVNVYVGALCTLNPNPIAAGVLHLILYPPLDTTYLQISNTECSVPALTSSCPNYLISAENVPTTINPGDSGTATWTVSYNGSGGVQACFVEPFAVNYACPALDCPVAAFTAPTSVCLGDDATLIFTGTASPTASYTWTIGNETLTGVGPQNVTFNTNGMVNVVLSVTDNGCTDTVSHAIMVSSVGVSLVAANTSVLLGEATTLTATATSVPPSNITYTWSPSGLSCVDAVCSGVLVTPTQNAVYSVTATNEYGCVASDEVNVSVVVRNAIIIPNAFSPNGDGVNDVFRVTGENIANLQLAIYDRWGQKVFEADGDLDTGWDGTHNGIDAEIAVYVYYINVTFIDGRKDFFKGNVTLVR